MKVKYYPAKKEEPASNVARFLSQHHVNYELVNPEEIGTRHSRLYKLGELPVIEIDGRVFINPNEDALKKLFAVA